VRTFYLLELTHYIYATLIIKSEPKQSDMWTNIIHHIASVILISSSYCLSYYRIGTTLLVLTDLSDPLLEFGKISLYSGKQKVADYCFILFGSYFIITRLIVFPYAIFYPASHQIGVVPLGLEMNILLGVLQLTFLLWSKIILGIGLNLALGKSAEDTRDEE